MQSDHYRETNERLLHLIRDNVDLSVALGLPDHLGRLGDPSLAAKERERLWHSLWSPSLFGRKVT